MLFLVIINLGQVLESSMEIFDTFYDELWKRSYSVHR